MNQQMEEAIQRGLVVRQPSGMNDYYVMRVEYERLLERVERLERKANAQEID